MNFNVIEFYNKLKNSTAGLPEWTALSPQHQHLVVNACNCLLQVCYDNNVTAKTS